MANRRAHHDLVTIVYPPGCREVSEDLGPDEMIRRLKTLAHTFQTLSQAEDESTYADYTPLAIHLADDSYLNNSSRDVQLLVACCIADILRIFAPEAPYKDTKQIKTIFYFLIKQLGGLRDPKDPAFKRYFYLLENLAYVKSFNMCFDLEDCSEIFCALFQLMFKIVNGEHSGKVKSFMLDVLTPLITEADFVSNELLDIILINIVDPQKSQQKNAYSLAKDLVVKTSATLEPYIQQFFNQVLILGKVDQKLQISRKVYDLIYELNHICPRILLTVLPQLEFKLKSTEEVDRMGSVALLARMFSEVNSNLATNHRQLWLAFLGRYNDISVAIRIKCVQYTMHFLLNHPELIGDIKDTLELRQHDPEENVRYEVVMAIVTTAKRDFDVVSRSEELLNFVKERTLDKRFKIRKEAISGLAMIYRKHLSNPQNVPEATKNAVTWIKDKILHGYYMQGMEDRLLVERLLNTCLVPFNMDTTERMKKLFLLFATIDENACKAFIEIQKNQFVVRKCVSELVALHRLPPSEKRDREIKIKIQATAKHLPEPVKATEFIRKLSAHLLTDKVMLANMEKITDGVLSCSECMATVNQVLKKLGSPIMTNLYYGTVKQLLERISSVMVDDVAIRELAGLVQEALNAGDILEELGLDSSRAGERGLRLLMVLSFVFAPHYMYTDVLNKIVGLLKTPADFVAPLALSVLTYIGKHKPLGDDFPSILQTLTPICKDFVNNGTPKQAKQSIKCLFMNATETQDAVFTEILEIIKTNLDPAKGDQYRTAIVALGHVAFHLPDKFPIQIKNLVSRKIVKELLIQDRTEVHVDGSLAWCDEEDLPLETRCKMEGMKMMARWLIGLKDDKDDDKTNSVTISAHKTFRILNAFVSNKGDLREEGKPSPAERAWFRLAAGCAILKICEQKGVGDKYTLDQFYTLSTLFTDPIPQVRERILIKLHKGLGRGIPNKCLPLDFMGLYALAGLDTDKKLLHMARQYMTIDIGKRKDYVKSLMMSGAADKFSNQIHRIMPDYMIVFAIPLLTHYHGFPVYDDEEALKKLQSALWFIMEPLMTKNDNFSFGFYKTLIEKIKNHSDARNADDEATNYKLWSMCDLAMGILISKTSNYELKEFPADLEIPRLFYTPPDDPNFVNVLNYLPADMMAKIPKKSSMINYIPTVSAQAVMVKKDKGGASVNNATTAGTSSSAINVVTENPLPSSDNDANGTTESQTIYDPDPSQESNGRVPRKRGRPPGSTKVAAASPVTAEDTHEEEDEAGREEEKGQKDDEKADPIPAKRARSTRAGGTKEKDNTPVQEEPATTSGRPRRAAAAVKK
ncbi:sister chromatid cohesion protein PDS5 homolog B-B-like isoform X2 [Tigriopus californicus]|uniref:sister chromatid cohesion protein PDS5 homolog B-B-like isoform X2 n=1 Tax=Tigriopus californicus TaxID=6832 RepID=UPI0027DA1087|nr:sister chromatid cohesion protein PDS5 homolog B-B-like isoform X2 [Tigriopus californicus]